MGKQFFYACGGVFLLALGYHLGATSAHGQGPTIDAPTPSSGVVGRVFYAFVPGISGYHNVVLDPVPGAEPVIATSASENAGSFAMRAMLANGDIYSWGDAMNPGWQLAGNLLGNTTGAAPGTWGRLKSRYR